MPPAIQLDHVGKRFRKYRSVTASTTLKMAFLDWLRGRTPSHLGPEAFEAVHDVTFAIEPGETFGMIGRNGAGKSTLLKLMARIYKPDSGRVTVNGRVAALIELGAGFHPEFTGAENVIMNGMLLGLSRAEVKAKLDAILAFADIGDFVHAPVRVYSSGMYLRLAFSVAIHVDPDVLLVDEILAVGDEVFMHKCLAAIQSRIAPRQRTTVIVSHNLELIAALCQRVAVVDPSGVRVFSTPAEALSAYRASQAGGASDQTVPATVPLEAKVRDQEHDLEEIARTLGVRDADLAEPDGPGKTPIGRAILKALRRDDVPPAP